MPILSGSGTFGTFTRGNKLFELSNHLGNVLVTLSDKKKGIQQGTTGTVWYYLPIVKSAQDYYPFGMVMPGRKFTSATNYRYGFNGKEEDDEVKGDGNQQDYDERIYDTRIGRFLSVDPLANNFSFYSPYQFAGNTPIQAIDLDGMEPIIFELPPVVPRLGPVSEIILESGAKPIVRPVIEQIVETGVSRPASGSSWYRWLGFGRNVHKEELAKWAKDGFDLEKGLGKFGRVDGIKRDGGVGIIRELKPDSKFGRSAGYEQLARYVKGAQEKYPKIKEWKLELYLYRSTTVGLFYTVQANDNLSTIATKFGVNVQDLMTLNNINGKNADVLQIGEVLLVDVGFFDASGSPPSGIDNTAAPIKTKVFNQEELLNPEEYKKKKKQEAIEMKQRNKEYKKRKKATPRSEPIA